MRVAVGSLAVLLLLLTAALVAPVARAEPTPWHMYGAGSGGWTVGSESPGLTLDGLALGGFHFAELGVAAQFSSNIFATRTALSLLAGVAAELGALRLGLWAEWGGEIYASSGGSFGLDLGQYAVRSVQPFAGLRATAGVRIAQDDQGARVWLGLTVLEAFDLATVNGTSVYTNYNASVATAPHTAGPRRWAVLGTLSFALDL
jgi:hypothetical protein